MMPSSNARRSFPALNALLTLSHFLVELSADPQTIEAGHGCSSINYTDATVFKQNLNAVFSAMAKNMSSTGFATASNGQGTDAVFALAQCRNDLSMDDCDECYRKSQEQIVSYCPRDNGARMIYDGCFLRYENATFFDQALDLGFSNVCTFGVSPRPLIFNQTVRKFLAEINDKAAKNGGFEAEKTIENGLATPIYGLAMCRRTLSTNSCEVCLKSATQRATQCLPYEQGRGLEAGCYLRYSTSPFFSIRSSSSSPSKIVIILVATIGGAALIFILCLLFIYRHKFGRLCNQATGRTQYKQEEEEYFAAEEGPVFGDQFKYNALRAATKNFNESNKIGEGGFGQVYKGIFSDGTVVAVKKLFSKYSTRAMDEFVTEIELLSGVRHRNLVRLLGGCRRGVEKLLVYEFMPNRSLDKHLFGDKGKSLSWKTRFEIILGTAQGLAYLNEESRFRIVHRDIKAANILLDNDFQPKIADFGLARLFPEDQTHLTTRVGGTIGYTAPEYAIHGQLTQKADVYSFGVLVLEIVGGRKNMDPKLPPQQELLLEWAWSLYEKNEGFEMVDKRVVEGSESEREEILRVIHIALLCTQGDPEMRPPMSNVVSMLRSTTQILTKPTQPAFVNNNFTNPDGSSSVNIGWMVESSLSTEVSNATVSVSELQPR